MHEFAVVLLSNWEIVDRRVTVSRTGRDELALCDPSYTRLQSHIPPILPVPVYCHFIRDAITVLASAGGAPQYLTA